MLRSQFLISFFCIALTLSQSVARSNDESNAAKLRLSLSCAKLFARFAEERDWTGDEQSLRSTLGRAWVQVMRVRFAVTRLQNWKDKPEKGSVGAMEWKDVEKSLSSMTLLQGEDAVQLRALIAMVQLSERSIDKTIARPSSNELSVWLTSIRDATSAMEAEQFVLDLCVAAIVSENPDFATLVLPEANRPANFMNLVNEYRTRKEVVPPGDELIEMKMAKLSDSFKKIDELVATRIQEMMTYKERKTQERKPPTGRPGNVTTPTDDDDKGTRSASTYKEAGEFLELVEKVLGRPLTAREASLVLEMAANEGYTVIQVVDRIREMDKIIRTDDDVKANGAGSPD